MHLKYENREQIEKLKEQGKYVLWMIVQPYDHFEEKYYQVVVWDEWRENRFHEMCENGFYDYSEALEYVEKIKKNKYYSGYTIVIQEKL